MNQLDRALHGQLPESSPGQVSARVEELIESHHTRDLLVTTGTHASVAELVLRSDGLEQAVRELAAAVEKLATSRAR